MQTLIAVLVSMDLLAHAVFIILLADLLRARRKGWLDRIRKAISHDREYFA